MNCRLLTYKAPKSLPKQLIYKIQDEGTKVYNMASTKSGEYVGKMVGDMVQEPMASQFYPSMAPYDSFLIRVLLIKNRGQGYGTKFINLAKAESKAQGGEGRVHLIASKCYTPSTPPHTFYRKLGFTSQYDESVKEIDKAIKKHKPLASQKAVDLPMYLDEETKPAPKSSIWNKLKNLFK